MRTHETTNDRDAKPRGTAASSRRKIESAANGMTSPGPIAQRKHREMIDNSPYMTAQKKRVAEISQPAVQKMAAPEEEELMQGKFAAQRQTEDEEELMQGKFAVQRQPLEEEEPLQGKSPAQLQSPEEEELMQGKFQKSRSSAANVAQNRTLQKKPQLPEENKTGIPDEVKIQMEDTFATDFSDVRVHPNSGKATEVGALAYTQGADVHFAPGQFKPDSSAGRQLLSHELTHVVQQGQGRVQPTGEVSGLPVNDSPDLENEADEMGRKVEK